MERKGIIAAGNMLVDHVHQIGQWPERGWLVEIVHSERATGGAPLNVLLTLAKMHAGLPLQAVGLIGEDNDGDYITAMLDQYHINRQLVQRTSSAPTSMTQVMTDAEGQRTFFHSPGANRLLDLPAFEPLDAPLKIFHLGYLLLLESLDRPDEVYGTRSARLLAQMRERGYEVSLDLVSRKGDPRYRPLVLPALKHLDYLTINELEASEFSGLEIRLPNGEPHVANIARAASALLDAGVRCSCWSTCRPWVSGRIISSKTSAISARCATVVSASLPVWLTSTSNACAPSTSLSSSPIALSSSTTKMTGFIFASARRELVSV